MKKNLSTYRRACGISSLWRGGKTKPEWYQGRHGSTKQETHLARGGIPSRLWDWEEVKVYQVASLQEITSWLLSWGSQVEVLEPPELRAELAQTAARLLERYQ